MIFLNAEVFIIKRLKLDYFHFLLKEKLYRTKGNFPYNRK